MHYLGKISGHGMLQRKGHAIAEATYEFEAFRHNQGLVRASGEISLTRDMPEGFAGFSRIELLTDDGELLEVKRPDADRPLSRHINVELMGNLNDIRGWQR
jgi:hypothetical protein